MFYLSVCSYCTDDVGVPACLYACVRICGYSVLHGCMPMNRSICANVLLVRANTCLHRQYVLTPYLYLYAALYAFVCMHEYVSAITYIVQPIHATYRTVSAKLKRRGPHLLLGRNIGFQRLFYYFHSQVYKIDRYYNVLNG